ncbi:hypothetical protein [Thermogemmatispora onikobensis]|uniref:hypothetical protein n=1 Tax=Thermogemmatispora onikobensis TaxID=732234 RepID=UPI000852EED3|nr:hypothetical protein [Thermogemmatispora onikobensis]
MKNQYLFYAALAVGIILLILGVVFEVTHHPTRGLVGLIVGAILLIIGIVGMVMGRPKAA